MYFSLFTIHPKLEILTVVFNRAFGTRDTYKPVSLNYSLLLRIRLIRFLYEPDRIVRNVFAIAVAHGWQLFALVFAQDLSFHRRYQLVRKVRFFFNVLVDVVNAFFFNKTKNYYLII